MSITFAFTLDSESIRTLTRLVVREALDEIHQRNGTGNGRVHPVERQAGVGPDGGRLAGPVVLLLPEALVGECRRLGLAHRPRIVSARSADWRR